jgi:branched-chain amino acid transport system ATP-binding protein
MRHDLLQVTGLVKQFGGLRAADNVTFTLAPGEVLALIGPNGSGKTTLLNLISGAFPATDGRIVLQGQDITALSAAQIARAGVARTFQLVRLMPDMTVSENVALGAMFARGRPRLPAVQAEAEKALRRVGMTGGWSRTAASLTYLDQKRVELARALAMGPRLLLLDEWLAGLNPTELDEGIALIRSVAADGMSIILIEHVMHAIHALASRCIVMNAGRIITDAPPAAALSEPAVIAAYIGDDDGAA